MALFFMRRGGAASASTTPTLLAYWLAESAHMTTETSTGKVTVQDWDTTDDAETLSQNTVSDQPRFADVSGENHVASTSDDEMDCTLSSSFTTDDFTLIVRGTLKQIAGTRYYAGLHGGTLANQYLFVEIRGTASGVEATIGNGTDTYATMSGTPAANIDNSQVWVVGQKNGTAYLYVSTEQIDTDTNGYSSTVTTFHLGAR